MRVFGRRTYVAVVLLAAAAAVPAGVFAQEVPAVPIDCGPFRVFPGDLAHVNVGNTGAPGEEAVTVQAAVMDEDGAVLMERTITLAPGQSRSLSVNLPAGGLVRGRVRAVSGPEEPHLRATMQATRQQRLRLTYGPIVECAGPTASRGPV
jgi:hypothetical protein